MTNLRSNLFIAVGIGVPLSLIGAMPGLFVNTPDFIWAVSPYMGYVLNNGQDFRVNWVAFGIAQFGYYFVLVCVVRWILQQVRIDKRSRAK